MRPRRSADIESEPLETALRDRRRDAVPPPRRRGQHGRDAREVKPHLGGANLPGRPAGQFLGASGQVETARLANYTLREVLSEASLARWGAAAAALFLVLMMVIACR